MPPRSVASRRDFLGSLLAILAYGVGGLRAGHAAATGSGSPFDHDWLRGEARRLAGAAYAAPGTSMPAALGELGWDEYVAIRYRAEHALWRDKDLAFQAQFFHLGLYHKEPVAIFEVVEGRASRVEYAPALFDYGMNRFDPPLPDDLGFAGFRLHFHTDVSRDMVAFLGASYFRAVGREMQYGISARGLAIDTALPRGEEFPRFTAFWIERPASGQASAVVHALLDSPSTTGAYRFEIRPGGTTVMDISATLYPRRPIERLGIAPLTSMYLHGENDRRAADDFRPEVHDSDGLAIRTGADEWIWRPLVNPRTLRVNSFFDENPRGFGLLQRDRSFANYQDDGVYYDRRPNLWVEPKGDWGRGAVQLVEIPTDEEIFDNIVAFWKPEAPVEPGREIALAYRLHWGSDMPGRQMPSARAVATRIGRGGIPGQKRSYESRKFVIDFVGGAIGALAKDAAVEPVISTSRGTIEAPAARPIEELGGWRTNFDLRVDGREPVDLRCYLRLGRSALTETWIYQWTPPA